MKIQPTVKHNGQIFHKQTLGKIQTLLTWQLEGILLVFFLFFGPCIFNNEDKINQQNAQINSGLIYY